MTERITNTNSQGSGQRINSGRTNRPTEQEREEIYSEFWDLYGQGLSDLRIAEIAGEKFGGICDRTVRRWRYRESLPNIYGRAPTYGG